LRMRVAIEHGAHDVDELDVTTPEWPLWLSPPFPIWIVVLENDRPLT
jgi:hypothetical protein